MIRSHTDGVVVEIWVVPGATRDEVVAPHGDALKVRTSAPAEGGRANREVARLVARAFGGSGAEVIRGHGSRRKQVLVRGVDVAAARLSLHRIDRGAASGSMG